jgi:hypothetical protein
VWSFGWWYHALSTGINPLLSHALYAPGGVNIAWTPSAPGLALAFTPLTALVGPVASVNVAGVLMPALSAWTAYLLCRYLTRSVWASLVGGFLFGFSAANFRQVVPGDVNLSAVFLFPLIALVVLRHLRGDLSRRGLAWRLGLLFAFQLTLSTEFAMLAALALAISLCLGYLLVPADRTAIRGAVPSIAGGFGLAILFAAPFVYYLIFHFETGTVITDISAYGTDLLAAISPQGLAISGKDPFGLSTHVSTHSGYLGLPTVLILALYAWRSWRRPETKFLASAFAFAFVATLGATLTVYGDNVVSLPWWSLLSRIPGFDDALPFRFAILEAFVAGIVVALWTARTKGRFFPRPYVLPALAVVALVPPFWKDFAPDRPTGVAFFSDALYRQCIRPGDTILVYGDKGNAGVWQAQTGFEFDLAQGANLQPFQPYGKPLNPFNADPLIWDLSFVGSAHPTMDRMLAFASAHHVARVVSVLGNDFPSPAQMRRYGRTETLGGVTIAPACNRPPLTARSFSGLVAQWETPASWRETRPNIGWCYGSNYVLLRSGLVPPVDPNNKPANFIRGTGITCSAPPAGYVRRGFADPSLGVPAKTYPYYAPA